MVTTKDHVAAGLLAIFLGAFGIHKFYLGYNTAGFIMLAVTIIGGVLTFSLASWVIWVIAIIEGILYLTKSQTEFEQIYVLNKREWFLVGSGSLGRRNFCRCCREASPRRAAPRPPSLTHCANLQARVLALRARGAGRFAPARPPASPICALRTHGRVASLPPCSRFARPDVSRETSGFSLRALSVGCRLFAVAPLRHARASRESVARSRGFFG